MFESIAATARALQTDRSLRAVVLAGNGRAFCTGLDVPSLLKNSPLQSMERLLERRRQDNDNDNDNDNHDNAIISNLAQDVALQWRHVPCPVICAIHGMCFGGGLQIALGADMRYCAADCQISIMETKWGLVPDMSASVTLRGISTHRCGPRNVP